MRIRTLILASAGVLAATAAVMAAQRLRHERRLETVWNELARPAPDCGGTFDAAMVADLPPPAQRWLSRAIARGTPLACVAVLHMHGAITLRDDADPLPLRAHQVLAPPRGLIWKARAGTGLMRIRGFDQYAHARGEMRWWFLGIIPVATAVNPDVTRSAAGRLAGEAALVPASLLPRHGARWEAVSDDVARVHLDVDDETVDFTIHVDARGRLERIVIDRWNGDPANGPIGHLPFIVDFDGERTFGGYTLPARMRAGWEHDGAVRPFFRAELDDVVWSR